MPENIQCLFGGDDQFGPRIDTACRSFDFTLLFEDTILTILPTVLFLLVGVSRLFVLRHVSKKLKAWNLAIVKQVCLRSSMPKSEEV
jgi:hypothetical protein